MGQMLRWKDIDLHLPAQRLDQIYYCGNTVKIPLKQLAIAFFKKFQDFATTTERNILNF
jgi:hypothetical protein